MATIGLLAALKKTYYLHQGLVGWFICCGVGRINILSVLLFQLVWSIWSCRQAGVRIYLLIHQWWFSEGWGFLWTPRSVDCVCSWQSYCFRWSRGLKDEEWNLQMKSTKAHFKWAFETENRQEMLGNVSEVRRYLYYRCCLRDRGIYRTSRSLCELREPFTVFERTF